MAPRSQGFVVVLGKAKDFFIIFDLGPVQQLEVVKAGNGQDSFRQLIQTLPSGQEDFLYPRIVLHHPMELPQG